MEAPAIRIGWLKMLQRLYGRHDHEHLYDDLLADTARLIAAAERELAEESAHTIPEKASPDVR
jgi:hypothetical protein